MRTLLTIVSVLLVMTADAGAQRRKGAKGPATFDVTSDAFAANGDIPRKYTCDGTGEAPTIRWANVPTGTQSIAVLVQDPDAPTGPFTHWMVIGIPGDATSLGDNLPAEVTAMKNGAGTTGWTGPCPPFGRHHYVFHVYALDTALTDSTTADTFAPALTGHILAHSTLTGTYERIAK